MSHVVAPEPLRQVFAEWLRRLTDRLARTTDESTVADVLAMADPLSGLSIVLERAMVEAAAVRDPLSAARVRALASREQLIEKAGGVLRLAEAARRLGVKPQAVSSRRSRGTILAVPMPNGEWVYPACQFTDHGIVQGLGEVLREFRDVSQWTQLAVLLAPSSRFRGKSALDLIAAGDREAARSIAATYGEQG